MPLEEFAKLTPEEKAAYKRQGDEMSRKTKEGYDKAKKRNFREGGGVKKYDPMEDEKQRRRSEGAPVRYTPPRKRKPRKPSDPAVFKRKKSDRGNERSIDVMKKRMKRKSGMNEGGIVDRNYLKGK